MTIWEIDALFKGLCQSKDNMVNILADMAEDFEQTHEPREGEPDRAVLDKRQSEKLNEIMLLSQAIHAIDAVIEPLGEINRQNGLTG